LPRLPFCARALAVTAALALATPLVGLAQTTDHDGHDGGDPGSAAAAFAEANARMHEGMDIDYTNDPDIDFARAMISHHQGAIDMAQIVLEYGDDPELRALAETIVAAQSGEIAILKEWLAANGG